MKAFKVFIKPFEAPQKMWKEKFNLIFSFRPGLGREGLTLQKYKNTYVLLLKNQFLRANIKIFTQFWSKSSFDIYFYISINCIGILNQEKSNNRKFSFTFLMKINYYLIDLILYFLRVNWHSFILQLIFRKYSFFTVT